MATPLQQFIIDRKLELLDREKRATHKEARLAATMQIQCFEIILGFLASQQKEEDMEKLKLSLDDQSRPISEIRSRRQDDGELTEILQEFAKLVPVGSGKRVNGIPPTIKLKSIVTKIYALRGSGKLPEEILPSAVKNELWLMRLTPEELEKFKAKQAKLKLLSSK